MMSEYLVKQTLLWGTGVYLTIAVLTLRSDGIQTLLRKADKEMPQNSASNMITKLRALYETENFTKIYRFCNMPEYLSVPGLIHNFTVCIMVPGRLHDRDHAFKRRQAR
jgi:hypothetical protein